MLDDIKGGSDVKSSITKRQLLCQTLLHIQALTLAKGQCIVGNIHALCDAELRKHLQVCPCAATDVEYRERALSLGSSRWSCPKAGLETRDYLPQEHLQDRSVANEPPVRAFHLVHDG